MGTAIATIFAALISGLIAAYSAKKTNEENKQTYLDVQKQSHSLNEESAEAADTRTRALYNDLESPAAKVGQLKSAGLSPGLMYGGGGSIGTGQVAPGAQASPAMGASLVQGMDISGILSGLASAMTAGTTAQKSKSEIDKNEAETKQIQEQTKKLAQETELVKEEVEKTKGEIVLQAWSERQVFTITDAQADSLEDSKTWSWGWSKGGSKSESNTESSGVTTEGGGGMNVDILDFIPGGKAKKVITKAEKTAKKATQTFSEERGSGNIGIHGNGGKSVSSSTGKSSGSSWSESNSKSEGKSHGESNSESHSRQILLWPKIEDGKQNGFYGVFLTGNYDKIAVDVRNL